MACRIADSYAQLRHSLDLLGDSGLVAIGFPSVLVIGAAKGRLILVEPTDNKVRLLRKLLEHPDGNDMAPSLGFSTKVGFCRLWGVTESSWSSISRQLALRMARSLLPNQPWCYTMRGKAIQKEFCMTSQVAKICDM